MLVSRNVFLGEEGVFVLVLDVLISESSHSELTGLKARFEEDKARVSQFRERFASDSSRGASRGRGSSRGGSSRGNGSRGGSSRGATSRSYKPY